MAHVIAVRDGRPIFAVGAPGGRRIMDTCLQMVIDMIDYGMDIQSACAAPLIGYTQQPTDWPACVAPSARGVVVAAVASGPYRTP